MPGGRPSKYSVEAAEEICARLAEGESLRAICREDHLPSESTVRQWALEDREGFSARYTQARDIGLDCLADEVLEIADGGSDDVARDRLRFDARRWHLSKLAPKRYGEKVEVAGDQERPIRHAIQVTFVGGDPGSDT